MLAPQTPGVYRADAVTSSAPSLSTGVPAFLGLAQDGEPATPRRLRLWSDFGQHFEAAPAPDGYLATAVEGFFANGGESCFVVPLDADVEPEDALAAGLAAIAELDDIDLVCAPDVGRLGDSSTSGSTERVVRLQRTVVEHCERVGTRIAILDALAGADEPGVLAQRAQLTSANATLYHPWILARTEAGSGAPLAPPCGHVAGIYSRTDRATGVHKAPANEVLRGAFDLARRVTDDQQATLNPASVNCLRAFPGRGIRVWGARTLSADQAWTYVNVRRLLLTVARWVSAFATPLLFEPQGEPLWRRIRRALSAFLTGLYRQGALHGASASEAFFVRCDAETNAGAEQGCVVVQLGLAASRPNEFIVVQFVQEVGGVSVAGPSPAS